jgi:hypothetical protein
MEPLSWATRAAEHETAHDPQRPVQAQSAHALRNVSAVMASGIASATEVGQTTCKIVYWVAIGCSVMGMIGGASAHQYVASAGFLDATYQHR